MYCYGGCRNAEGTSEVSEFETHVSGHGPATPGGIRSCSVCVSCTRIRTYPGQAVESTSTVHLKSRTPTVETPYRCALPGDNRAGVGCSFR